MKGITEKFVYSLLLLILLLSLVIPVFAKENKDDEAHQENPPLESIIEESNDENMVEKPEDTKPVDENAPNETNPQGDRGDEQNHPHGEDSEKKDIPKEVIEEEQPAEEVVYSLKERLNFFIPTQISGTPGAFKIDKKAKQIPVACRTYEITLSLSGNPVTGVGMVDLVFVIDNSKSMDNGSPADYKQAENIAKHFARVINENNTAANYSQVGLVTFNGSVIKTRPLSDNKDPLNLPGNYYSASGSSNISLGLQEAKKMLDNTGRNAPNVNQAIMIISDGLAYHGNNENQNSFSQADANTAIATANGIKAVGINIGAINLNQTTPTNLLSAGQNTLMAIASKVMDLDGTTIDIYATDTAYADPKSNNDLARIFNVLLYSAASDGVVTDILDPKFEFVDFVNYDGPKPTLSSAGGKETITWNVSTVNLNTKFMTYRVKAKMEYPVGSPVQGIVPTNERAHLSYTPPPGTGQSGREDFKVPDVYVAPPLKVSLTDASIGMGEEITLGAGTQIPGENVMKISGGWYVDEEILIAYPGRFNSTIPQQLQYKWYNLNLSDTQVISTSKNPTITGIEEDTQFKVVITDAYGCTATATMWVRPSGGSITITKVVTGNKTDKYNPNKKFTILVTNGSSQWIVTPRDGDSATIGGLKSGQYIITEIVPAFHILKSITNDGIVNLTRDSPTANILVTNHRKKPGHFTDDDDKKNTFKMEVNFR